ncbi:MAG: cardiolipin synthase [Steroidobacteraceae bacterium]
MERPHAFAAIGLLLTLAGCANLPEQRPDGSTVGDDQVQSQPVLSGGSALSERQSNRVLQNAAGATSGDERADVTQLTQAVRKATAAPFVTGNQVALLIDGPASFGAMRAAIAAAQGSVNLETYIFADDELGRDFAQLLMDKARAGVEVRVIFDAVGSIDTPSQLFDTMRSTGVQIEEYQPFRKVLLFPWRFHKRDHRKLLVVDGRVAFTGGMNISATYASSSTSRPGPDKGLTEGWRDTQARIEGPAVQQLQAIFFETWVRLGGMVSSDAKYFPLLAPLGNDVVATVTSTGARQRDEAIYSTYLAAIRHAQHQLWITQAYFAPPPQMRHALEDAARRGVDVRILLPGFTDSTAILYASQASYSELLRAGIRLYEMDNALLHAKTALVDDALVIIGSANLDYRSFLHNNEITAAVISDPLAAQMRRAFQTDLDRSHLINVSEWRQRSVLRRIKEKLSRMFAYWM